MIVNLRVFMYLFIDFLYQKESDLIDGFKFNFNSIKNKKKTIF
jgi:hypothetical protein